VNHAYQNEEEKTHFRILFRGPTRELLVLVHIDYCSNWPFHASYFNPSTALDVSLNNHSVVRAKVFCCTNRPCGPRALCSPLSLRLHTFSMLSLRKIGSKSFSRQFTINHVFSNEPPLYCLADSYFRLECWVLARWELVLPRS
jgi:hypothetical protein